MLSSIILATNNLHKIKEIESFFKDIPIQLLTVKDYPELANIDVEEDGVTFEENAVKKSKAIAEHFGHAALADDSGLEVIALDNAPGVHSSRFLGKDASYTEKNQEILRLLETKNKEGRKACFVCVAAIAWPKNKLITFRGECAGEIAMEPKGSNGFGYDPIFFLPDIGKTMAELSFEEKNKISHRGRCFQQVTTFLKKLGP